MAIINSRLSRPVKVIIVVIFFIIITIYSSLHLGIQPEDIQRYAAKYKDIDLGIPMTSSQSKSTHSQAMSQFTSKYHPPEPKTPQAHDFWTKFSKMLSSGAPSFKDLASEETVGWVTFDSIMKGQQPRDLLGMTDAQKDEMAALHASTVDQIEAMASDLPFTPGTRGIVTTAGWSAEAILATSLRMLRMSGSQLPVQVWFYNETDYDDYSCQNVYASLNTRCYKISDYLGDAAKYDGEFPLEITHHFQMKILTMLFSTFEQVLFVDCDLFPVMDPDDIFITEPFISSGFVLWPDYWARTNSPDYFRFLKKEPVDMFIRASTESGAMLVNKATHVKALLLAAYYNKYGPSHYYWLFSQGAIGHGDKDTYVPSLEFFDLPFYQIDNPPRRFGFRCNDNERAIASAQTHPNDDWVITSAGMTRNRRGLLADTPEPRILFIHGNLPKYDAPSLIKWYIPESWDDQQRCDHGKGQIHRLWGPKEFTIRRMGWDVEKSLWDQMLWYACTHGHTVARWQEGTIVPGQPTDPLEDVCTMTKKYYAELLPLETYDPYIPSPKSIPYRKWGSIVSSE